MDKVAEFIASGSQRQALARLCRLAVGPTADGRRVLDDWEALYGSSEGLLERALDRLDEERPNVGNDELERDPLLWLRALDRQCHRTTRPSASLTNSPIADGTGHSQVLPLYPGWGGGARARQFGNLGKWLEHHRVFALDNPQGIPVAVGSLRGYEEWYEKRLQAESIKIAVVNFDDGVGLTIDTSAPGRFVCPSLDDEERRFASLIDHIRAAKKAGAHILVMPELTITPALRKRSKEALLAANLEEGEAHSLSVPLIVLGSFHEIYDGRWRNHAQAVSGLDGGFLFAHDKRKAVSFPFPDEPDGRKEGIERAPTPFTCVLTPLGLMAMVICKDLFEPDPATLLESLPLDWLLVPSMSDSLGPHEAKAANLAKTGGTIVVVANQEMPGKAERRPGFVQQEKIERCASGMHLVYVDSPAATGTARPRLQRVK